VRDGAGAHLVHDVRVSGLKGADEFVVHVGEDDLVTRVMQEETYEAPPNIARTEVDGFHVVLLLVLLVDLGEKRVERVRIRGCEQFVDLIGVREDDGDL
jgi:hypothetical protein